MGTAVYHTKIQWNAALEIHFKTKVHDMAHDRISKACMWNDKPLRMWITSEHKLKTHQWNYQRWTKQSILHIIIQYINICKKCNRNLYNIKKKKM